MENDISPGAQAPSSAVALNVGIIAAAAFALMAWLGAGVPAAGFAALVAGLWTLSAERALARTAGALEPIDSATFAAAGLGPLPADASVRDVYLDTMKRALLNLIYHESSVPMWRYAPRTGDCERVATVDLEARLRGADYAANLLTLIGSKRLDNLETCIDSVLERDIPGDLLEAGSYRGGACIYMKAVLRSHPHGGGRRVFVCDTFSPDRRPRHVLGWVLSQVLLLGVAAAASIPSRNWHRTLLNAAFKAHSRFPPADQPSDYAIHVGTFFLRNMWRYNPIGGVPTVGAGVGNVRSHFARFGLLDDDVVLLPGFFADTLPAAPITELAVLRLDGDTYESTMDALTLVYDKLSTGGFCIIDDYHIYPECQRAVEEYRAANGIDDPIERIDSAGAYWMKGGA